MADSILRLKVESQEYDNKLKQATNELTRYVDECRKVGGTLEVVEKDTLDYVRALGQMETTSRTATGKLAEMKKAFVELSAQYKSMTDEEKNSPFGKALASSLDQLKGRITDSKKSLDDINKSINGGGGLTGALDSLTSKFGMSIQSLAGWGAALSAGKVALDVAKDAFFASEATVDEWGRVMDSSKSLYEGFLTALNTGDISGYLSRIDSIVKAARAAYNEIDRLGTVKTIQAPQISAQQTENERMRMMIQTGHYIAPVDGRRASMQNGQLLTPDQIKRIEQQLQGGMQKVVTLVGNEVAQTGRAIDAVYNRQAQELGMSLKEFRKGTSSMDEFDKRIAGYDQYQKWRAEHTTIDMQSGRETVARGNPFEQFAKWGTFRVDGDRYNDLVKLIQQRDQQAGSLYGMQSQAYRTMNRAEGVTLRQIMGGGSGGGRTLSKSEQAQQKFEQAQKDYNQALDQATLEVKAGTINSAEAKKKELQATESLWKSIGDARETYDSPKLKEAQAKVEQDIIRLGGEVTKAVEAQKQIEQASREHAAAQKKLSEAHIRLSEAQKSGNLKEIYAAEKKVTAAQQEVKHLETIKVNVETGTINLPDIPKEIEQVVSTKVGEVVTPDIAEELTQVVNIVPGTVNLPDIPKEQEVNIVANTENISAEITHLKEKLGGLEIGNLDFNKTQANLVDMTTLQTIINEQMKNGLNIDSSVTNNIFSRIKDGFNIDDNEWRDLINKINEKLKEMKLEPISIEFKTGEIAKDGKIIKSSYKDAASAVNSLGSALSGLDDPGAKIAGTIAQAIANIALAFSSADLKEGESGNIWYWIAATAAGMATMISTISAIHSATGYQNGGVVKGYQRGGVVKGYAGGKPVMGYAGGGSIGSAISGGMITGSTYSNDQIPVMANAGEVVLTNAMTTTLASKLNDQGNTGYVPSHISGEQIYIALNRFMRRSGRGEIVTWKS